jgi:hypothetical protein
MLPGFRFLFSAIVLSMSILIFGLGAAALLRAAHEQFASNPSWHSAPATMFAQPSEASGPVLALLRVDPPSTEQPAPQDASRDDAVPADPEARPAAEEAVPVDPGPAQAETVAALSPEDAALKPEEEASPAEPAKPEIAIPEIPGSQGEAAPARTDGPVAAGDPNIAPLAPELTEPASAPAPPSGATADKPTTINELLSAAAPQSKPAPAKVAARGDPSASAETPQRTKLANAKPAGQISAGAKHDTDAEEKEKDKKRLQALRAKRHRIAAARARLARQQAEQMQPANPFAPYVQPSYQPAIQADTP